MADNFNLRQFLSENKLTKNAKLINEGLVVNGKEVDYTSIETDGDYPSDVYIVAANFEDGTSLSEEELQQLENEHSDLAAEIEFEKQSSGLDHDEDYGVDETREETTEEGYTPKSKLEQVIQQAWAEKDLEKAKQLVIDLIEPSKVKSKDIILQTIKGIGNKMKLDQYLANSLLKFEKLGLNEDKMTTRERRLVEMVQDALGYERTGTPNPVHTAPVCEDPIAEEGEEMVQEKPLPTYESVEDLMKEIEHGTNKAMYEYKILEMKRIAKQLEEKVSTLEESEHAAHINSADVKKMKKDILTLHKGVAKIEKEYDRKFNKKTKTSEPKEEKESVTLAETKNTNTMENFDLKKFLVENKLTTNSKVLKEYIESDPETIAEAFSQAGVDLSAPTTVESEYGHSGETESFATGQEALSYLENKRAEAEAEDPEFNEQGGVTYEYGDSIASWYEGDKLPKLAVNFSDIASYFIIQ